MLKIANPTGQRIRQTDEWGSGRFGALRPNNRLHRGADFICKVGPVGQLIVSPIGGYAVRETRPYSKGSYSGILIHNDQIDTEAKMFYLLLDDDLLAAMNNGERVRLHRGDSIGYAQDIRDRLPGITPHVHCEISQLVLHDNKIIRVFIDPEPLL